MKLATVANDHVAVACCRRSGDAGPTDLYPDPDAAPLQAALRSAGASSELVAWDDPGTDWACFSHVLVSSTWDSVDRPGEYGAWAWGVADVSCLVNPPPVIQWAIDKVHQRELAAAGIPVVATAWVEPGSPWDAPPKTDFVVKPSVSAGGRATARYGGGYRAALAHVRHLQGLGQTVMVQEYLSGIDDEGEVDLVFFNGLFSHAVLKKPLLRAGEGVVDRPWERLSWAGLTRPSTRQLEVAVQTVSFISDRLGCPLVYARVDLVPGCGGPLVLEVELIDPYLSLDLEPQAATRFVRALLGGP
ncbi:MAG TPA: hypothetical protein VEJ84_06725 [Acidimicrobiales bacterium]|nr:hypothetical protein [Acidimicrobiales bacterium]